jgi:hypothetical protein
MATCGNRAKVARHREKKRVEEEAAVSSVGRTWKRILTGARRGDPDA